jgi:hypothetical protein
VVLAAHVLHDADVAAVDDDIYRVVAAVEARPEVRAVQVRRERVGVVGVRVSRIGACDAPFGTRTTVCSFTPSRIGIMTTRRS